MIKALVLLLAGVTAAHASSQAKAHDKISGAGYVDCVKPYGQLADEDAGRWDIGVINTCTDHIVATLCTRSGSSGKLERYSFPVNLPPGERYAWSIWDPEKNLRLKAFSCRPSARCQAGEEAHDPHCHE